MRSAVLNKENVSVKLKKNLEIKFNNHVPKKTSVFYTIKYEKKY